MSLVQTSHYMFIIVYTWHRRIIFFGGWFDQYLHARTPPNCYWATNQRERERERVWWCQHSHAAHQARVVICINDWCWLMVNWWLIDIQWLVLKVWKANYLRCFGCLPDQLWICLQQFSVRVNSHSALEDSCNWSNMNAIELPASIVCLFDARNLHDIVLSATDIDTCWYIEFIVPW